MNELGRWKRFGGWWKCRNLLLWKVIDLGGLLGCLLREGGLVSEWKGRGEEGGRGGDGPPPRRGREWEMAEMVRLSSELSGLSPVMIDGSICVASRRVRRASALPLSRALRSLSLIPQDLPN